MDDQKRELIQFYAEWCGPCQQMMPVIEEIKKEFPSQVKQFDVDKNPKDAQQYNIMSIPTFLIVENGKVIEQLVGIQPKSELSARLK